MTGTGMPLHVRDIDTQPFTMHPGDLLTIGADTGPTATVALRYGSADTATLILVPGTYSYTDLVDRYWRACP